MRFWFQTDKPEPQDGGLTAAFEAKLAAEVAALPLVSVQLVLGVLESSNALSAPVSAMLKQACINRGVESIRNPMVDAFVSTYLLVYEQGLEFTAPEVQPHFSVLKALHCDAAVTATGTFLQGLADYVRSAGLSK